MATGVVSPTVTPTGGPMGRAPYIQCAISKQREEFLQLPSCIRRQPGASRRNLNLGSTVSKMRGVISRFIGQLRCALRVPVVYTLRLHPLSTGVGEGEALGGDLTVGEQKIIAKLRESFPDATAIQVSDISGGCGAMYQISIEAPAFTGLKTVQQHRLVNEALANEIKAMHGLQLQTKAPDNNKK